MAAAVEEALNFAKDAKAKKLGLAYNGKKIGDGHHIAKAETHTIPQLTLASPTGTYLVVCIDLDAPFSSWPFLSPILHWLQPGLSATSTSTTTEPVELSAPGVPFVTDYAGAGPPPGAGPHRYVFLLYEQPEDFDGTKFGQPAEGKKVGISGRVRFDFAGFLKKAKLGPPVAANWYVSN